VAKIAISQQWFSNFSRYIDKLQADSQAAADNAVNFLRDRVVEKAKLTPEWSELADQISVWSQDGKMFVGVNNQDYVSAAMALEYGDEVRPPSALFRSLSEEVQQANQRYRSEMESKGYVYGSGIYGAA
jgi:molybdopterin converting factor small subunit